MIYGQFELLRLCLFAAQFELQRQRCGVSRDSHQSSSVPTSVKLALRPIVRYTSRIFLPYATSHQRRMTMYVLFVQCNDSP